MINNPSTRQNTFASPSPQESMRPAGWMQSMNCDGSGLSANAPTASRGMQQAGKCFPPFDLSAQAVKKLRVTCSGAIAVVPIRHVDAHHPQAARSNDADVFINTGIEMSAQPNTREPFPRVFLLNDAT